MLKFSEDPHFYIGELASVAARVNTARRRIEDLRRGMPAAAQDPISLSDAIQELETSFETLSIAEAELRAQTAQIAATQQLVDSERQRYWALFNFAPDAYLVTDLEGVIREVNFEASALLGAEQRHLVGKPLVLCVYPDDRKRLQSRLEQIAAANVREEWTLRLQGPQGHTLTVALTTDLERDREGHPTGVLWLLRDVSERLRAWDALKTWNVELERRVAERTSALEEAAAAREAALQGEHNARQEAEAASRLKDEFLATLSHELRTPLNAITSWLYLLRSGRLADDRTQEALTTISQNTEVLTQLISDLLDVSRIVAGKLRLDRELIHLPVVIDAAIDTVWPAAEARGLTLERELDEAVGPVRGDAGRLQQVVWNLLSNAIKFTPHGRSIRVCLESTELDGRAHAVIHVRDRGVGIVPDLLPHVFDRFRQGSEGQGQTQRGMGLGLAIVRHLVELHGGIVEAQSDGAGWGSRFSVYLPIAAVESPEVQKPVATPDDPREPARAP